MWHFFSTLCTTTQSSLLILRSAGCRTFFRAAACTRSKYLQHNNSTTPHTSTPAQLADSAQHDDTHARDGPSKFVGSLSARSTTNSVPPGCKRYWCRSVQNRTSGRPKAEAAQKSRRRPSAAAVAIASHAYIQGQRTSGSFPLISLFLWPLIWCNFPANHNAEALVLELCKKCGKKGSLSIAWRVAYE